MSFFKIHHLRIITGFAGLLLVTNSAIAGFVDGQVDAEKAKAISEPGQPLQSDVLLSVCTRER